MRRPIVPLTLLPAAVAALWVLALTGSATAASRSTASRPPRIICSVLAVQPPSCCPLPTAADSAQSPHVVCCPATAGDASQAHLQPICCGTTPCCSTCCTTTCCPSTTTCCTPTPCGSSSVTIAVAPNPSRAGQKVVISGTTGASAQVVLWRKLARQSSFAQAGQTTADSTGHYTFTLRRGTVMADQQWYVTSDGAQSVTVQQQVDALVGLTASSRSTLVGRTLVLRGDVTPSHAGEVVLVEMSRGGTWVPIARPRLGRRSSYAVSYRLARAGTVRFRVILNGDARNDRSISRSVMVKVRA
jgi:hypothetical protein